MSAHTVTEDWAQTRHNSLLTAQDGELNLDLAAIVDVDSAGLAWLINMQRDCNQQQIALRLINLPQNLAKLAKISDVDRFLPVQ